MSPSRSAAPELGIVIVSYNTRALLAECLASVATELERQGLRATAASGDQAWAQVCVVDNASEDGSAAMVTAEFPWVRLIALDANVGFTAGNNRALRGWARPDGGCPRFVLLLNPDAALTPGSLGRLMATLREHPEAGAAGPALRYPDGRFQHAAFRFPGIVQTVLDLWPVARLAESTLNGRYAAARYASSQPFPVDFVLGACLTMTGDALRRVGPLDEGYVMYCEEIDWCKRALDRGLATLCEPRAVVVHHGGAASGQRRAAALGHLWRSRLRWFAHHTPRAKAQLLRAIVRAGLWWRQRAGARAFQRGEISGDDWAALGAAYRGVFAEERA